MMRNGGRGPVDPRKLAGYGFVAAMVAAPFLALIYGWNAGLGVMTFALASTTYLVYDASKTADPAVQPRLRSMIAINALMTVLLALIFLLRVM